MSSRIGKYQIVSEVGRGGMGVVYRAWDDTLHRHVALKSPLAADASDDQRRRFLREARLAAAISHPHIVPIFDAFESDGQPWIAMAFVEGEPLRDVLARSGALPVAQALTIGAEIAGALGAAHRQGVLHRDVKPANIMLDRSGHARLADFGVARTIAMPDGGRSLTGLERGILGTVGYVAPEQLLGRDAGPSSDVFSLGAVIYECLTGVKAHPGASPGEQFDATLHLTPAAPSTLRAEVPAGLDAVLAKALAKDPAARFPDADAFAGALAAASTRVSTGSSTTLSGSRLHGPAPRVLGGVAGLGAAAAAVWLVMAPASITLGPPLQLTAGQGWEADPALAPDGHLVAYASNETGHTDIWLLETRDGTRVRLTDDAAEDRSPAWFPDGTAVAFVSVRDGQRGVWKVSHLGGTASLLMPNAEDPAVSPDGSRLAFVRRDQAAFNRVHVLDLKTGAVAQLTRDGMGLWDHRHPTWSAGGQALTYQAARDIWTVTLRDGKAARVTTSDAADQEPQWLAGTDRLIFSSNREGTRALWTIARGGTATRLTGGQGPERQPSLSTQRARLIYSTFVDDSTVVMRDLPAGREQVVDSDRQEEQPVFSPDGRRLAFVSDRWAGRYNLFVQDLDHPEQEPRRLTDHDGSVAQPAFSADGRWIAYYRVVNGARNVWVVDASGGIPAALTATAGNNLEPVWAPDGRAMAFVSNRSGSDQLWTVPVADGRAAGVPVQRTFLPVSAAAPAWSPDGATLAFVSGDSDVYLVDAHTRRPPVRVTTGADAWRLVWHRASAGLWVSGQWGSDTLAFRRLDVQTRHLEPSLPFVLQPPDADFDITADGGRIAFGRRERHGHIWSQPILHARSWWPAWSRVH